MINIVQSLVNTKNLIFLSRCSKRYAGHSKWANIKHDKAIKDAKRALNFNRLRRMMSAAITEGNSANPEHNVKLAQILEQAKKASMPMSTINKLLSSAQESKVPTKSGLFEIRGPEGSVILAEYACDNYKVSVNGINVILKKTCYKLSDSGALHLFDRKGVVSTEVQESLETATEHAIQVDAEDVQEYEYGDIKEYHFICDPYSLNNVMKRLRERNYIVKTAEVQYIPHTRVNLSEKYLEAVRLVYEKLEANEDIIKLYDNIA